VIVSANTHSFILNFTDLSFINCLIPQNLCFDLIILSSTAIFSFTTYNLVNDLFKKQVYVIGAVRSNSSAMPTVFKEKKRWMRENCKSRRFQMAQRRQICDCTVERL
jgi:hypothetical protein